MGETFKKIWVNHRGFQEKTTKEIRKVQTILFNLAC